MSKKKLKSIVLTVLLVVTSTFLFHRLSQQVENKRLPENCLDGLLSEFIVQCKNQSHKLVIENGVACCRCQQ